MEAGEDGGETSFVGDGQRLKAEREIADGAAGIAAQGLGPGEHGGPVVAFEGVLEQGAGGGRAPFGIWGPAGQCIQSAVTKGGLAGFEQDDAEGDLVDGGAGTVETEGGFKTGAGGVEIEAAAGEFAGDVLAVGGFRKLGGRRGGKGAVGFVGVAGEEGVGGPGEDETGVGWGEICGLARVGERAFLVAQTTGEVGGEFPGFGEFGGDLEGFLNGFGGLVETAGVEPLASHRHGGALAPPRVDPDGGDDAEENEDDGGVEGKTKSAVFFEHVEQLPPEVAGAVFAQASEAALEAAGERVVVQAVRAVVGVLRSAHGTETCKGRMTEARSKSQAAASG